MTATQSQIMDALEHLDSGDISWQMWLMENSDIIRHCLQSALDTQKPAGEWIESFGGCSSLTYDCPVRCEFTDGEIVEGIAGKMRWSTPYPGFPVVKRYQIMGVTKKRSLTGDCGWGDFVSVPVDLIHKVKVLINFHVKRGACIDIDDKLFNEGEIYSELNRAHLAALSADKPAVFYCENGQSLDGLEQGALAVLSNLMMKTNATSAEFMIGNEKDGKFYFTCSRNAPQPVEEIEGLEEAITMSASACYMEGVRAYYDTTWIDALVEASRRYLALTADNAKRGE